MKKNNKKGFTLVELVIVVAVMAVLVAVAIPTIGSIKASAEKSVSDTNARTIESMIKLAEAEADGAAPGADAIDAALTEAKLGIEKGTFVYNTENGTVKAGTSAAAKEFLITFDSTQTKVEDQIKVTAGTTTPTNP